jgi:hypothetical protein
MTSMNRRLGLSKFRRVVAMICFVILLRESRLVRPRAKDFALKGCRDPKIYPQGPSPIESYNVGRLC